VEIRDQTAVHLPPGEGKTFAVLGCDLITFKVVSEDTEGAFSLVEGQTPPQGGPPPHIHHREDEWLYVVEGEYELLDNDRTIRATAGSCVYLPKGRLHTFKNVGDGPGKVLFLYRPGGFEKYFGEPGIGEPVADPSSPIPEGPPDIERVMAVSREYDLEIPPPPGQ
jgi:mannose-6-phosphate isomerase-like protein (cupin superfamily)